MASVSNEFLPFAKPCQSRERDLENIKVSVELLLSLQRQEERRILKYVKNIIEERADIAKEIFTCDVYGWTCVHACVLRGSFALVRLILSAGVDANCRLGETQDGLTGHCTLLHLAAYRGDYKIVKLLLSYNAKVDAIDTFGEYPLDYAKRREHERLYSYLQYETKCPDEMVDAGSFEGLETIEQSKPTTSRILEKLSFVLKMRTK